MEGNDAPGKVNLRQVVEIVSSYVRHNTIAADDLPRVIADVYRALAGGEQSAPVQKPQRPAVPIRRSVKSSALSAGTGPERCGAICAKRTA